MNHETTLSKAKEIAERVLAPAARQNDKEGRFSIEAVDALGQAGLLAIMLPTKFGGAGLGPRTFAAVTADHLERPRDTTLLRVLETKAAAGDIAIGVTSTAMRICGGSAFSKQPNIERLFRDAHAGAVMAPTGDVLREFIAKAILGMPVF